MYFTNDQKPVRPCNILGGITNKCKFVLLLSLSLYLIGCTTLFHEHEYVLIDRPVDKDHTYYYDIFSLPEKAKIRKIRLIGEGKLRNIEIHVRDAKQRWQPKKKINQINQFPLDIPLAVDTDAIKIKKYYTTVFGEIKTIQFFTVADTVKNNH